MELLEALGLQTKKADLSENIGFNSRVHGVETFDDRSDKELIDVAHSHPEAMERERAIWELAYRQPTDVIKLISNLLDREAEASLRWNMLWLGLKVADEAALTLIEKALSDNHPEVRDWAKVFLNEVSGTRLACEYTEANYTESGDFDQTLPLQIAGYALLQIPGMGTRRATLSPLWFEHIMGRVLACTNLESFHKDLTIEKELEKYHPDGSNHYEIFKFAGTSWATGEGKMQHRYESASMRNFYHSGKVEEKSEPVDKAVPVILNRAAQSSSETLAAVADKRDLSFGLFDKQLRARRVQADSTYGNVRGVRLLNGKVVRTVGGQFFGWAHTSLQHFLEHAKVLPGTVQLANPLHDSTANLVNTYLCGTFRGKLGDQDGDGRLDINTVPCHGNSKGELDYFADGTMSQDPFE